MQIQIVLRYPTVTCPGCKQPNDAVAAIARFSRYGPLRRDLYLQELRGDYHSHNQDREVIGH